MVQLPPPFQPINHSLSIYTQHRLSCPMVPTSPCTWKPADVLLPHSLFNYFLSHVKSQCYPFCLPSILFNSLEAIFGVLINYLINVRIVVIGIQYQRNRWHIVIGRSGSIPCTQTRGGQSWSSPRLHGCTKTLAI